MKKFAISAFLSVVALYSSPALAEAVAQNGRQMPAPSFFMPQSELAPRYEKLPQIRPVYNTQEVSANRQVMPKMPTVKRAKSYIAVDGRYIPVIEEDDVEATVAIDDEEIDDDYFDDTEELIEDTEENEFETELVDFREENLSKNIETPLSVAEKNMLTAPVLPPIVSSDNSNKIDEGIKPSVRDVDKVDDVKQVVSAPNIEPVNPNAPMYRNRYNEYLTSLQVFELSKRMPYNQNLEETLGRLDSNGYTPLFKGVVQPEL